MFATVVKAWVSHVCHALSLAISCGSGCSSLGKRHSTGHLRLSRERQSPATSQPTDIPSISVSKFLKAFHGNGFRHEEMAWESTTTTLSSSKRIQP